MADQPNPKARGRKPDPDPKPADPPPEAPTPPVSVSLADTADIDPDEWARLVKSLVAPHTGPTWAASHTKSVTDLTDRVLRHNAAITVVDFCTVGNDDMIVTTILAGSDDTPLVKVAQASALADRDGMFEATTNSWRVSAVNSIR